MAISTMVKNLKNKTIQFKLKLLMILVIVIYILFFFPHYFYTSQAVAETAKEKGNHILESVNTEITSWLYKNSTTIKDIALLFSEKDYSDEEKLSIMEIFLTESNFFSSIYYGDKNNKMINASGWKPYEGFQLTVRPWYINAINENKLAYTNIFLNASRDDMIISISYPVVGSDEDGVISGDVSVKTLIQQSSQIKPSQNGFVFMMDFEGNIIAHPDFTDFDTLEIDYKNPVYMRLFQSVQSSQNNFQELTIDEQTGFLNFKKNDDLNLFLFSFIPTRDLQYLFIRALNFSLVMMLITIFLALIIYRLLKQHVVHPLEELKKEINTLDFQDNFDQRLTYNYPNEFSSLVKTINQMLSQAEETFIQKESAESELSAMNEELINTNERLEKKNTEAQTNLTLLYKEKELLNALFENVLIGIQIWDESRNLLLMNSENKNITGYTEEEIKNLNHWFELINLSQSDSDEILSMIKSSNTEEKFERELEIITKEGLEREVEFRFNFLSDGRTVVTMNDITPRRLYEEKLRESEKKANAANIAKSEFLANMSHELRTPLNGIIGFSQILANSSLSDEQKKYVEYINYSGQNLLQIISDILDFSKIEAGRLEIDHIPTSIDEVAHHSLKMIEPLSIEKGLKLEYSIDDTKILPVYTDPLRLNQIINNLLSNAVKFTSDGTVSLKIQLIDKDEKTITCQFSVTDTGIGIEADKLTEIFQSFTQADNSISREFGGTGLGLTISNSLLEYMGSLLKVKSRLGEGSTFYFVISFDRL
ncbi:MAG: ATP-binding protein [Thermotogota bacterium]